jgi:hypothetical protein
MHTQEATDSKGGLLAMARLLLWLIAGFYLVDVGGPSGGWPRVAATKAAGQTLNEPATVEAIVVAPHDERSCALNLVGPEPGVDGEASGTGLRPLFFTLPAEPAGISVEQCPGGQSLAAFNPRAPPRLG